MKIKELFKEGFGGLLIVALCTAFILAYIFLANGFQGILKSIGYKTTGGGDMNYCDDWRKNC